MRWFDYNKGCQQQKQIIFMSKIKHSNDNKSYWLVSD